MMSGNRKTGLDAVKAKGLLAASKWLILRRASQAFFLSIFLAGPVAGIWIVKGTIANSLTLDFLPLSDPFILLQSLVSGHVLETTALIGAAIVIAAYMLVGGRVYCAWVCPVNVVTDAAHWVRQRLGLKGGARLARNSRYWILAMVLAASFITGVVVWELVNPVTILFRGLLFGMGAAWMVVLAVFLFDLFVSKRGWCGHLCPVGAFYSLIGAASLIRVGAFQRQDCNDCMDCFAVCPEPHVISPALKGSAKGVGPLILAPNCTNCGRCIDVCALDVFSFSTRFTNRSKDDEVGPVSLVRHGSG
jgi:ferredoxin-type protein NapH